MYEINWTPTQNLAMRNGERDLVLGSRYLPQGVSYRVSALLSVVAQARKFLPPKASLDDFLQSVIDYIRAQRA